MKRLASTVLFLATLLLATGLPAAQQTPAEPQPTVCAEFWVLQSLHDNPGLFVDLEVIPCIDSGIPCPNHRFCKYNVCPGIPGCQCNGTCQICS